MSQEKGFAYPFSLPQTDAQILMPPAVSGRCVCSLFTPHSHSPSDAGDFLVPAPVPLLPNFPAFCGVYWPLSELLRCLLRVTAPNHPV